MKVDRSSILGLHNVEDSSRTSLALYKAVDRRLVERRAVVRAVTELARGWLDLGLEACSSTELVCARHEPLVVVVVGSWLVLL